MSRGIIDGKVGILGISSSVIDGKVNTLIDVSAPQFLTRNETLLPSSFSTWGTTASERTINHNSNTAFNGSSVNSFLIFKGSANSNVAVIRNLTNDLVIRGGETNSFIKFQNCYANDVLTYNTITNQWATAYNLTVSGTFQSPLTSLIGVSISSDNITNRYTRYQSYKSI